MEPELEAEVRKIRQDLKQLEPHEPDDLVAVNAGTLSEILKRLALLEAREHIRKLGDNV